MEEANASYENYNQTGVRNNDRNLLALDLDVILLYLARYLKFIIIIIITHLLMLTFISQCM